MMESKKPLETFPDRFQKFQKTPQLGSLVQERADITKNPYWLDLKSQLDGCQNKQDVYDLLRRYKFEKIKEILPLETNPLNHREKILNSLTDIADAILTTALFWIQKEIQEEYGIPTYLSSYQQVCECGLIIVGMGKFGSREMNYESDIDSVFVYSHVGETNGRRKISNDEYYSKLIQRLTNMLSLATEHGKAYDIDMELRPSGNSGPLVISFERFLDHQMNEIQPWERMAWLKSRPITILGDFLHPFTEQLNLLCHERPMPENFFSEMAKIRERVITEKVKTANNTLDLKRGRGGLMDIDFILHARQLQSQQLFPELKTRGSFPLLRVLKQKHLLPDNELAILNETLLLFRTLESKMSLLKKRAENILRVEDPDIQIIANELEFGDASSLFVKCSELASAVHKIYRSNYGLS